MRLCKQCKKPMNPVEVMLGQVCGKCTRENHAKVIKQCSVCLNTGFYINARGVRSNQPCNMNHQ